MKFLGTMVELLSYLMVLCYVKNVIPKHMFCISAKLREMGMVIQEEDDSIRLEKTRRLKRAKSHFQDFFDILKARRRFLRRRACFAVY